jgi:hypothetical protein
MLEREKGRDMDVFWIDFAFSIVIQLLRSLVTNPESKAKYEKVFLKVFTLIWGAFQTDNRFRAVVGLPVEPEE